ncbi:MAG: hypothetical protein R2712_03350 [Vicinamibacterales bacterium]
MLERMLGGGHARPDPCRLEVQEARDVRRLAACAGQRQERGVAGGEPRRRRVRETSFERLLTPPAPVRSRRHNVAEGTDGHLKQVPANASSPDERLERQFVRRSVRYDDEAPDRGGQALQRRIEQHPGQVACGGAPSGRVPAGCTAAGRRTPRPARRLDRRVEAMDGDRVARDRKRQAPPPNSP